MHDKMHTDTLSRPEDRTVRLLRLAIAGLGAAYAIVLAQQAMQAPDYTAATVAVQIVPAVIVWASLRVRLTMALALLRAARARSTRAPRH